MLNPDWGADQDQAASAGLVLVGSSLFIEKADLSKTPPPPPPHTHTQIQKEVDFF